MTIVWTRAGLLRISPAPGPVCRKTDRKVAAGLEGFDRAKLAAKASLLVSAAGLRSRRECPPHRLRVIPSAMVPPW